MAKLDWGKTLEIFSTAIEKMSEGQEEERGLAQKMKQRGQEKKQDFMYKMMEDQMSPENIQQQKMQKIFESQYGTQPKKQPMQPGQPTGQMDLPYGGDVSKFATTRRVTPKSGGKMGWDYPGEEEIYKYLQDKKQRSITDKKIKFDKEDEEKLGSIEQKIFGDAKQKVPTWKQAQEIESIKKGIQQGVIAIKTEWGGSEIIRPKTKDEAMEALVRGGHNPYLYEDELDTKFGFEDEQEAVVLPDEITTTSQARDYLTGQGMSEDEAIEWLRSQ